MKIALYRKYRPKVFKELLGQDHVTQTLKNAIKDVTHSHAYIFTGPRGVGKTSAARLVATSINCGKGKDGEPCLSCDSCTSILGNKAIDIIEIDAASNRGIDEIRELKEKVKFSPNNLKYKVFIIDEVHMLTKEAFNALLKTLEEPPSHAVFILATTEIHKVPQTILSRCQRFDFRRITIKDLVSQLKDIAKKENIKITDEALSLIAESSEGGFRDAISYLDQISSYKEEINERDVSDLLGMSDYRTLIDFTKFLKTKDTKSAIELINSEVQKGVEMIQFAKNIIEFMRKLLLYKVTGADHVELAEEHLKSIQDLSEGLSPKNITDWIQTILENTTNFRNTPLPQLPLEISVVEICQDQISSLNRETKEQEDISEVQTVKESKESKVTPKKVDLTEEARNKEIEEPQEHWPDFLLELKGRNASCHALLKACTFEFGGDELKLCFPFKFHKERIEDRKNKKVIEEALKKVYNRAYQVVCSVKQTTVASSQGSGASGEESSKPKENLIESAVDIFGGTLVDSN